MEEKRMRMDEKNMRRSFLTKDMKKRIGKRVQRLQQLQKIDDFTEMKQIRYF